MALYRCAACGSSHVVADTKKEGFSVSKAMVGTALFGAVGTVMGVNGKEQMYYHCADCGQVLSYPMSQTQKWTIDYALENKELSSNMEELENLKKQYSGIEWSEADSRKARKVLNSKVQNITDEIVSECIDFIMKKSITSHDELAEYLSSEGYDIQIIRESKRKIAWKKDVSIKLLCRDGKLFYQLCYDETGTKLQGNNVSALNEYEQIEKDAKYQSRRSELEEAIITALSKYEEPVKASDMQHDNYALGFYTIEMLRRALKDLCEKQIVKETVIERKAYFSLLKEDDSGLTNL